MLELENVDIAKELAAAETVETPVETPVETTVETTVEAVEAVEAETPVEAVEPEDVAEIPEVKAEKKGDPAVALRLARKEAKELKEQLKAREQAEATKFAELEARLKKFEQPEAEPPAFDVDPAANLKHELDTLKTKQAALDQQTQVARMEGEIHSRLSASESEFIKDNPDYAEASKHVASVIEKNIESFGITDPAKRQAALKVEIQKLTVNAIRQGKDPAELIYTMAKNFGFTAKQPAKDTKIETIAKGQETRSLGNGSRTERTNLSLEAIARMDDDDYSALVADPKQWKQIEKMMH